MAASDRSHLPARLSAAVEGRQSDRLKGLMTCAAAGDAVRIDSLFPPGLIEVCDHGRHTAVLLVAGAPGTAARGAPTTTCPGERLSRSPARPAKTAAAASFARASAGPILVA